MGAHDDAPVTEVGGLALRFGAPADPLGEAVGLVAGDDVDAAVSAVDDAPRHDPRCPRLIGGHMDTVRGEGVGERGLDAAVGMSWVAHVVA